MTSYTTGTSGGLQGKPSAMDDEAIKVGRFYSTLDFLPAIPPNFRENCIAHNSFAQADLTSMAAGFKAFYNHDEEDDDDDVS